MMKGSPGTLWIGDIEPYMDETFLKQSFAIMGETLVGCKIITSRLTGLPVGYGFVEFSDEATALRVLHKCDGKVIPNANPPKRFKLNHASHGKDNSYQTGSNPGVPGQDYRMYYPYSSYGYQNYYSPWQGYQQYYGNYSGYAGYGSAYSGYGQQQQQQQQQQTSQGYSQTESQYYDTTYEDPDNEIEDHDVPFDADSANEVVISRNEEFYESLDASRWLPVDDLDPPLIPVK